jgi:hypothetical protein
MSTKSSSPVSYTTWHSVFEERDLSWEPQIAFMYLFPCLIYVCIYLFIYLFFYLLIVRIHSQYSNALTIWEIAFWFSSGIQIFLFAIGPWPFLESTQSCMIQVLGIFLWCKVCGAWHKIKLSHLVPEAKKDCSCTYTRRSGSLSASLIYMSSPSMYSFTWTTLALSIKDLCMPVAIQFGMFVYKRGTSAEVQI